MTKTQLNTRFLIILILLYGTLLIYASLMPFTFTFISLADLQQQLRHNIWSYWPFNPFGRVSGSDVVSNLALYFPLGFLLTIKLALIEKRSTIRTISITLAVCVSLSCGIEFIQIFIVNRVASASDLLLNILSALAGAIAGIYLGRKYFHAVLNWIVQRWQDWPLDIFTILLLLLLCADALSPFLPTIKLSQVWHSVKRSHFNIVDGFSLHPWHWWIMIKGQPFHLLSLMLAYWNRAQQHARRWVKIAGITTIFALGLELIKPMIATRDINLANVIASAVGSSMILVTAPLIKNICKKNILNLAILSISSYLLYLGWVPFNFHWSIQAAGHKLPATLKALLPLYDYAMGATLDHARLFVQNITLAGMLVYLLRLRYNGFENSKHRIYFALMISLMIGLLQEGGQLFMLSRTPSITDIYCFMLGSYLSTKIPLNDRL